MAKSLKTLQEFISVPSVSGAETKFVAHLYDHLKGRFEYDVLELQEVGESRHNIIMKRGDPALTLTSHIDTVPTNVPPRQKGNTVYGTGACDAKGQIVTQLLALEKAIEQGLSDYACFYVVGEEVDSRGAIAAATHPLLRGQAVLNGEPTDNLFVTKTRGVIELTVRTEGTEKHSSQLPLNSATHKMIAELACILTVDSDDFSVNVGTIKGGVASNVSAAASSADLCIRTAIPSNEVIQFLKIIAPQLCYVVTDIREPLMLDVPIEYQDSAISVNFCSDSAHFALNYHTNMLFGPGSIKVAHSLEEHITLDDIMTGAAIITELLLNMNKEKDKTAK